MCDIFERAIQGHRHHAAVIAAGQEFTGGHDGNENGCIGMRGDTLAGAGRC